MESGLNGTAAATPGRSLAQFVSLGLLTAAGSAGNGLALYAFGRFLRARRRTPHAFMAAFAALDLLRALCCFPLCFVAAARPLEAGGGLCRLLAGVNALCLVANSLNVCGMALDRYLDGRHRAAYRRHCRAAAAAAPPIVLGLAAACALPAAEGGPRLPPLGYRCTLPRYYDEVGSATVLSSVATAFLLTNIAYIKLFFLLRSRRRMRPVIYEPAVSENWGFYDQVGVRNRWMADSLSEAPIAVVSRTMFQSHPLPTNYELALWRSKKQKENERLTRLCFGVHVLFYVMWLPYVVVLFIRAVNSGRARVPEWAEASVTWLTYIQATVTPMAFSSLSGLTRKRLRVVNGKRFSPTFSSSST